MDSAEDETLLVVVPSTDDHSQSEDSMTKEQRIANIKSFLESKTGLDVWQYAAFRLGTEWEHTNGIMKRFHLILCLGYPLFAFFFQIVALYAILEYWAGQSESYVERFVDNNFAMESAHPGLILFAFCLFILLNAPNIRKSMFNEGFYGDLNYIPKVARENGECWFKLHSAPFIGDKVRVFVDYGFLNMPLLWIGYVWNMILWFVLLIVNVYTLAAAEDPLDAILNIMAVYFIGDIDNCLVSPDAYSKFLHWFEDKENVSQISAKPMSAVRYKLCLILSIALYSPFVLFFLLWVPTIIATWLFPDAMIELERSHWTS